MKLLLDTNVLLDYYIPTRDVNNFCKSLIEITPDHAQCYVPANIINDFFFIGIRELKDRNIVDKPKMLDALLWSFYDHLKEFVSFVGCDESDLFVADKLRNENYDMEDNLVVASAMRCGADYLVTNDKNLLKKQLVPTKSPKQIINLISKKK